MVKAISNSFLLAFYLLIQLNAITLQWQCFCKVIALLFCCKINPFVLEKVFFCFQLLFSSLGKGACLYDINRMARTYFQVNQQNKDHLKRLSGAEILFLYRQVPLKNNVVLFFKATLLLCFSFVVFSFFYNFVPLL